MSRSTNIGILREILTLHTQSLMSIKWIVQSSAEGSDSAACQPSCSVWIICSHWVTGPVNLLPRAENTLLTIIMHLWFGGHGKYYTLVKKPCLCENAGCKHIHQQWASMTILRTHHLNQQMHICHICDHMWVKKSGSNGIGAGLTYWKLPSLPWREPLLLLTVILWWDPPSPNIPKETGPLAFWITKSSLPQCKASNGTPWYTMVLLAQTNPINNAQTQDDYHNHGWRRMMEMKWNEMTMIADADGSWWWRWWQRWPWGW